MRLSLFGSTDVRAFTFDERTMFAAVERSRALRAMEAGRSIG